MAFPYISQTHLENRWGAHTIRRCCDDDGDGVADTAVITRICTDSSSVVRSYLDGLYTDVTFASGVPEEILQLTLDVAHAMLAERNQEIMRIDPGQKRKRAEADLKSLRENRRGIAGRDAENEGGIWGQGDPDTFDENDPPDTFTANGFSDY